MEKCIIITHCRRSDYGGEDVALDKISGSKRNVDLKIYEHNENVVYCMFKFLFSLNFLFFVLKNRDKRHVVCNPFPNVSLVSVLILSLLRIRLRLYVHNFSLTCVGGTMFIDGRSCETHLQGKYCLRRSCTSSIQRYCLNLTRYYVFYKIFSFFRKNKFYFVSEYQAALALQAGLLRDNSIIAGNVD
jgi:hypothetical protein